MLSVTWLLLPRVGTVPANMAVLIALFLSSLIDFSKLSVKVFFLTQVRLHYRLHYRLHSPDFTTDFTRDFTDSFKWTFGFNFLNQTSLDVNDTSDFFIHYI